MVGRSLFTFITLLGDHLTTDHLDLGQSVANSCHHLTRGPPSARKYLKARAGRLLAAVSRRVGPCCVFSAGPWNCCTLSVRANVME